MYVGGEAVFGLKSYLVLAPLSGNSNPAVPCKLRSAFRTETQLHSYLQDTRISPHRDTQCTMGPSLGIPLLALLLCAGAGAAASSSTQKPLPAGGSVLTEDFAKRVADTLAKWHVPGMAIAVVDGADTWAEVSTESFLSLLLFYLMTYST